ncbi:uncharacterized protein DUF2802 [Thiogranum longum]|uniref:Uncharacterized protein DUF2802 n=1 Tax=Thiogranum longum TaxID=1537524 RepID=A0A4V2PGZ7_9GAMM|nr:DUF2802 domain-containing protein [Thiogranum longum]TCK18816.1 uncharacterized protein DUF2802 [Thiogranum longum]
MTTLILSFLVVGLLGCILLQVITVFQLRGEQTEIREQHASARERIRQLEQELGALCNASVGAGEHVLRLEHQMQRIIERQNDLEMRAVGERPYNQASQLVNKGADIEELVDTCGLTRGEAELLVMMQRRGAA